MRPHSRTVASGLLSLGIRMAPSEPHGGSAPGMTATETMSLAINLTEAFRDLVQIGIALTSERDLSTLLNRIMAEARRFTRAEAGAPFLPVDGRVRRPGRPDRPPCPPPGRRATRRPP